MLPVVAIVGRPNVGKSTLFNRILKQRKAIVEDFPGVTRDRNYAEVTRFESPFLLVDTGGFEPSSDDLLLTQMREQSQLAVEEADIIFFLMDVKQGVTPADTEVAAMLRQVDKPVLYLVNKVDGDKQEDDSFDFYSLGIEKFYTVSAEHGRGINELMDDLMALLPPAPEKASAKMKCAWPLSVDRTSASRRWLTVCWVMSGLSPTRPPGPLATASIPLLFLIRRSMF